MIQQEDVDRLRADYEAACQQLATTTTARFESIAAYLRLLHKWNRSYNLTAIRDIDAMFGQHILTSLAVIPFIRGQHCLDIGSGAGIPGLVLAMSLPQSHWTLIDSNGKKTRFMQQAVIELKLQNVEVVQQRIEQYAADTVFSTIIARSWTALPTFYRFASNRLADDGILLAMKAGRPDEELEKARELAATVSFRQVPVPGSDETIGLVQMTKK